MNTMHDFHASVESISQLWNLFNLVRNEGTFFTTLEFISPGNLQEQISHQLNLYNIIFLWNMFYQNFYNRTLFMGELFFILTPTAFRLVLLACKLNLPLVPSQDYVLQDNKRCYDTMLSDWNFRPPSNVFW